MHIFITAAIISGKASTKLPGLICAAQEISSHQKEALYIYEKPFMIAQHLVVYNIYKVGAERGSLIISLCKVSTDCPESQNLSLVLFCLAHFRVFFFREPFLLISQMFYILIFLIMHFQFCQHSPPEFCLKSSSISKSSRHHALYKVPRSCARDPDQQHHTL